MEIGGFLDDPYSQDLLIVTSEKPKKMPSVIVGESFHPDVLTFLASSNPFGILPYLLMGNVFHVEYWDEGDEDEEGEA